MTTLAVDNLDLVYVTLRVDNQLLGIPVDYVRDVLREQKVTPVPLAPKEVAGSLNLRGRIVTVINLRRRLCLPARLPGEKNMFVVVEYRGELYSLIVDHVEEVLTAETTLIEPPPANLSGEWKEVATGILKLPGGLLVMIDVPTLLTIT